MTAMQATDSKRKRAPSKRALATRDRVLDAAELVFAQRGFDGATIRDIAAEAGEPVGTIHHHGGGKEALFHRVVARRAETLAQARLDALALARSKGPLTLDAVLSAFMRPFFDLVCADPRWRHYARLVAFVSAEDRWQDISQTHFDPTAGVFLETIAGLLPGVSRTQVAECFVYAVSTLLALVTSGHRMRALGADAGSEQDQIDRLIRYCAAGFRAA